MCVCGVCAINDARCHRTVPRVVGGGEEARTQRVYKVQFRLSLRGSVGVVRKHIGGEGGRGGPCFADTSISRTSRAFDYHSTPRFLSSSVHSLHSKMFRPFHSPTVFTGFLRF